MPARKMIQVGKVKSILKSVKAWSLLPPKFFGVLSCIVYH